MAIKGKGKTRGGRAVAPAPRPVIVTRKPPIWRRKPVWIGALVVVVGAILFWVISAIHTGSVHRFEARQRNDVSAYSDRVVAKLPTDAQSVSGSTLFLFPDASTQLDDLASGKSQPADSLAQAKAYTTETNRALKGLQAIHMGTLIPADLTVSASTERAPGLTRTTLRNSQFLIVQGLHVYSRVFTLWQAAAAPDTTAALRKSLAGQAKTLAADAEHLFDKGWTIFVQLRHQAGLAPLPQFNKPTGTLPVPGQGTTPPSPSGSPSESPPPTGSPSSSPSGSGSPSSSPSP